MTDWGWATSAQLDALTTGVTTTGDRDTRNVRAPATGNALGDVASCTPSDIETAIERAREAQRTWNERPIDQRIECISRLHDIVLDRRADLTDLVQAETGKARRDAFEEILDVAITARYYANHAADLLATDRRRGALPVLTKTRAHHHPLGVVGLITPWNYPLTLPISDAIPALLAGNTVVVKPDQSTPFSALIGKQLLEEAGVPGDVFQVCPGPGATLGDSLIEGADYIGFTGSTAVGRSVAERAGRQLTPLSLELGGKNPLLVLDDADVQASAEGAVRSCFANAGQLCVSTERAYVHDAIYDDFLDAFIAETRELEFGVGAHWGYDVGSLTPTGHADEIHEIVQTADREGATVRTGGQQRPDIGPNVYEPTILTDVPRDAAVNVEESFGPVVAVHRVDDAKTALEHANDSPYGLHGVVFAGDTDRGGALARHLECGTVSVNDAYPATWASIDAPMGGMNESGLGRRHGRQGLLKYTESQTVSTQRGHPIAPGRLAAETWANFMSKALRAQNVASRWRR